MSNSESWTNRRESSLSVPSWYGSDNSEEEKRKPTRNEDKYISSRIKFSKYFFWGGILLLFTFSLIAFALEGEDIRSKIYLFAFVNGCTIIYYFIAKKYTEIEFDKDRSIRRISGIPKFPSGALAFYSGFYPYITVGGIQLRVPLHWAFHLLDYDFGGREIEVEIYETEVESYALSMSNGLSIEKEVENGLFDLLIDGRWLYVVSTMLVLVWFASPLLTDSGALVMIGIQDPGFYNPPDTWGAVFFQTPTLIFGGLAAVLGPPALWFYAKHRKALHSIKEMYREEGVIE